MKMASLGRSLFRLRNVLAGLPLAYALFSTRWEWENELGNWTGAILLCFAGAVLRGWASSHCYYGQTKERRLSRTGPYAIIRNPLYVGNILIIAGVTLSSELAWLLPISVIWAWCAYSIVISFYEEPRLESWYGEEFRRYRSVVPAWIPASVRVTGLSSVPSRLLISESARLLLLLPFVIKEWF